MIGRQQWLGLLGLILIVSAQGTVGAAEKKAAPAQMSVLGWVESVYLEPWGFKFRARLDTGAKTSSISARDIVHFEKDDASWVRFVFDFKEDKGMPNRAVVIERPLHRNIKIKRHGDKIQHRPVVLMDICINGETHTSEFSLIDRSSLNYPMLLGRRLLKNVALVDSGKSFIGNRKCADKERKKKKKAKE